MVKVILDDAAFYVDTEEESYKAQHVHEFYDCLEILLTERQLKLFTERETARIFIVGKKRFKNMVEFLEGKNNIWRKGE